MIFVYLVVAVLQLSRHDAEGVLLRNFNGNDLNHSPIKGPTPGIFNLSLDTFQTSPHLQMPKQDGGMYNRGFNMNSTGIIDLVDDKHGSANDGVGHGQCP